LTRIVCDIFFEIVHIPGKKNGKANSISRIENEKTENIGFDKDIFLRPYYASL